MAYYAFIENDRINGCGQTTVLSESIQNVPITEEIFNNIYRYMWDGENVVFNSNWEQEEAQKERQRIDSLTLTPTDVERALYSAKNMDFDDLKALIAERLPQVDIKGLAIEFRARDFWRGAEFNNIRIFDVIGQLLGYTSNDMDYLFIHKELPVEREVN